MTHIRDILPFMIKGPLRAVIPRVEMDLGMRTLDALDVGVVVFSADVLTFHYANRMARDLLGEALPEAFRDAVDGYVLSRRDVRKPPPALRVELGDHALYVRVVPSPGSPPLEVVLIREEVLRDVDAFKLLNARFGISRREHQILTMLRLGKTNRQIAIELGLAEGTVGRHVHRLLERFDAPNRTRLVDLIEQLIARR